MKETSAQAWGEARRAWPRRRLENEFTTRQSNKDNDLETNQSRSFYTVGLSGSKTETTSQPTASHNHDGLTTLLGHSVEEIWEPDKVSTYLRSLVSNRWTRAVSKPTSYNVDNVERQKQRTFRSWFTFTSRSLRLNYYPQILNLEILYP